MEEAQMSPKSNNEKVPKKPFLTRGSGNAGGKGLAASNMKTPLK